MLKNSSFDIVTCLCKILALCDLVEAWILGMGMGMGMRMVFSAQSHKES